MTGDIEWIKLSTGIFKDEKMEVILSMPDGEAIFLTWIRLLCLAGKINDHGLIYLAPGIRYTDDTFATVFRKTAAHIHLAMDIFIKLGIVISRDDGVICIRNWEKYQNSKGLDEIREANRIRNIEYRKRQKTLLLPENDGAVISSVISRDGQEIEIEQERKNKKESRKRGSSFFRHSSENLEKDPPKKPIKYKSPYCPKCGHVLGGHSCPSCDWKD